MSNFRRDRINEETFREMTEIIRDVKDPRISSGFMTITRCDVTPDLKFAKIYFSVLDGDPAETLKGLKSASGFMRRELSQRLNLRATPSLTFIYDSSMEHAAHMQKLFREL